MKAVAIFAAVLALIVSGNAASIADLAASTPDLSTLDAAIMAANLTSELSDPSVKLTVFAPTNDAFTALLGRLGVSADTLLNDKTTLQAVLAYHVVPGIYRASQLMDGEMLTTLLPSGMLRVMKNATGVTIYPSGGPPAMVKTADIVADNGIVHIIDTVLLPGAAEAPTME